MLKNVGKDGFEILGQTGVPPVTYPDLAGMALGWADQNSFCPGARAARRAKKFPFRPGIDLGGIGMLKNVGKDGFQILGQTGVPPVTYPDLAGMALGWAGQN